MNPRLLLGLLLAGLAAAGAAGQVRLPEPNPPAVSGGAAGVLASSAAPEPELNAAPGTEWAFHKTADGAHPSAAEQQMVWLMNRARRSPEAEGIWLAHLRQANVQFAMDYFGVQRSVLMSEFAARAATPPGAFDVRLYLAASNHSAYLISIDGQNHDNQFQRILDQGFHYTSGRGSVFSYSEDAVYGHAGFNVDWGPGDGTGMQPGRGHREGLMGSYSCVGVACVAENNPGTDVGPLVTTINYCNASTSYANHYNRFLVGTVWKDANTNELYEAGEGLGGVTVMPDKVTFYAVTGTAGGYAIPITSTGTYGVTFSGGGLSSNVVRSALVGSVSVLLDVADSPGGQQPMQSSVSLAPSGLATYLLSNQRKGSAYRLSASTNLASGGWSWAGVLPSGYGAALTYSAPLYVTNAPQRFLSLMRWTY
jgi:hypothetical protein